MELVQIKKGKAKDQYIITFKRKGEMQMPIDFTVTGRNDSTYNYYIPNSWFEKKTNATILPRWIGWGKVAAYLQCNSYYSKWNKKSRN